MVKLAHRLGKNESVAHRLVAKVAEEMCHEMFDSLMRIPSYAVAWKKQWPELGGNWKKLEQKFVNLNKRSMLQQARVTLTQMLTLPSTPQAMKDEIFEALRLDATMTYGRAQGPVTTAQRMLDNAK